MVALCRFSAAVLLLEMDPTMPLLAFSACWFKVTSPPCFVWKVPNLLMMAQHRVVHPAPAESLNELNFSCWAPGMGICLVKSSSL